MTIALENAFLCLDCDRIGDDAKRCPACLSEALLGLDAVLNRSAGLDTSFPLVVSLGEKIIVP